MSILAPSIITPFLGVWGILCTIAAKIYFGGCEAYIVRRPPKKRPPYIHQQDFLGMQIRFLET